MDTDMVDMNEEGELLEVFATYDYLLSLLLKRRNHLAVTDKADMNEEDRMVSCYALHIACPRHLQIMDTDKVDMNQEGERYK